MRSLAFFLFAPLLTQCGASHPLGGSVPEQFRYSYETNERNDLGRDLAPETDLLLETYSLAKANLYWLAISQKYSVEVAQAESLQTVEAFADQTDAIAALNAGFFDPNNAQTTSHILMDGVPVANPAENQRLVGNPDLAPYLDQILDRSEFRRYECQGTWRYDITLHSAAVPATCELIDAVGAGPQLLPQDLSEVEGFIAYDNGILIRDAIGSQRRNARSAVGLTANGQVVFVMVAQTQPDNGMTLAELTEFMAEHGIVKALNLDGGSSSSLVFGDDAYYGRLDADGQTIQRPIKSVLWVREP